MQNLIFSNSENISVGFAERVRDLVSKNAIDLAVLLLCSASGWKQHDHLIGEMVKFTPALSPIYEGIIGGMVIDEVCHEFGNLPMIDKALELFRDIGFFDMAERQKADKVGQLINSVQSKMSRIGIIDKLLCEKLADEERESITKLITDIKDIGTNKTVEPIDPRKEYPKKIFIFRQIAENVEKPFIPIGNLSRVKAPIKQGKSKLADVLASMALSETDLLGVKNAKGIKVVVFDTEQDEDDVKCRWKRIARFANLSENVPHRNLTVYPLQDLVLDSVEDARTFIEDTIKTESRGYNQTLVIIDGINDLGEAELDKDKAKTITKSFQKIAKDTKSAIVGVIHQNRNSETTKGWLGLVWDEKATSLLKVSKDKSTGVFTISMDDSRHGEIEPIRFCLDDYLTISAVSETKLQELQSQYKKEIEDRNKWYSIFGDDKELSSTELSKRLVRNSKEKGKGFSDSQARNKIKSAADKGILRKGEGNKGLYSIVPDNSPNQTEFQQED